MEEVQRVDQPKGKCARETIKLHEFDQLKKAGRNPK